MVYHEVEYKIDFLPADKETEEQAMALLNDTETEDPMNLIPVEQEEVEELLRRSSTLRFFQRKATWEAGQRKEAIAGLCEELKQASAAAQAEFGPCLRLLFQLDACASIQLDEVEQCAQALTEELGEESVAVFYARMQPGVEDGFLQVRCLVGGC